MRRRSPNLRSARLEFRVFEEAQPIAQNKKSGPRGPTLIVEMIMSGLMLGTNSVHCKHEVQIL